MKKFKLPNFLDNSNSRKSLIAVISILLVICMIVSISYAFFVVLPGDRHELSTTVDIPSCASVTLSNTSSLNLSGDLAAPISDKKALNSDNYAFEFTVSNACAVASSLKISLAPTAISTMPVRAIKYALVEKNATKPTEGNYLLQDNNQKKLTSQIVSDIKKQTGATVDLGYEILNSTLASGTTKNYILYLWIDYYEGDKTQSGQFNNTTMNKTLDAYLVVSDYSQTEGGENRNFLSEKVLAKVSNNDYTSSQDQTVYRVRKETATGPTADATYTKVTNYGTPTLYSTTANNSYTATSGTDATGKFTKANDGTWTSNGTVHNTYYHVVLPIQENGYYEVCYNLGTGSIYNTLQAYVTDKNNSTSGSGGSIAHVSSNKPQSGCQYIGYLTTEKAVRIVNRAYTSIASVSFYLQKTNEEETYDAGVRYEGKAPDNYVQFNGNEEWRIIGVFEGSTIGLEPGKQYTKIIRNTPMYKAWDEYQNSTYENDWTNSTLKNYLNGEYLQSLTDSDKIAQYNGNYSTWYLLGPTLGQSTIADTNEWYFYERTKGTPGYKDGVAAIADATTRGAIGLMYPSDYGYGAYGEDCTSGTTLYNYGTWDDETGEYTGCGQVDWLMLQVDFEWLISPYPDISYSAFGIGFGGSVGYGDEVGYEWAARPVLYLEADVYVTGGTGKKNDPYKIAKDLPTLSDTVLAKESDSDYTSSQDQTVYRVKKETATGPASDATYTKVTNYGTTKIYSATTNYATNGTDASSKFTKAADGTWTNNGTVHNTYYHVVLPIQENGYYEVCYNLGTGNTGNYLYAFVTDSANTTSGTNIYLGGNYTLQANANTPKSGCTYAGYLTTDKAIRIVNRAYTSIASVSFYLQKTNEEEIMDAGVRYEGKDPDNYITFNENEEWRIIGVFEGSTIGLEPGKQYTKIIRNTPMSKEWDEYYYDEETEEENYGENDWKNSTLNTYLNGEYLQSLTDSDKIAQYNGNYSTWYLLGPTGFQRTIADTNAWYFYERITGTPGYKDGVAASAEASTTGAIGLMYPSDYGYGAYGEGCTSGTTLNNYGTMDFDTMEISGCASVDWLLLENDAEWLISPYPDTSDLAFGVVGYDGGYVDAHDGVDNVWGARPVLYLGASVKIAAGAGTKENPYKLS